MLTRWVLAIAMAVTLVGALPARGATALQNQAAIEKAVKYLYAQESAGTWDQPAPDQGQPQDQPWQWLPTGGQWGGMTGLATYSLLSAGEDSKDPRLASAIKFLEKADIQGVYALGERCLVWHSIPNASSDPAIHDAMLRDLKLLERAMIERSGMYNYCVSFPADYNQADVYDHSVSQYGVLGMWALQESGMEVPLHYWQKVENAWQRDQSHDWGWDYLRFGKYRSIPSMTEAGIASLFIAQDELLAGSPLGPCHGNVKNAAIDRGLDWMSRHFDEVFTYVEQPHAPYYALYGLERIGAASGRVYFKDINWYSRGSDFLVKTQSPDGSWPQDNTPDWDDSVSNTSLALLFLARGGAPVTMNKLQYYDDDNGKPKEGDWNERPRDIANFNPWVAQQTELPGVLNWQVLSLEASPVDLHSAPVLMVSGDKALKFGADDEQKLKKYIDQGGLVVFNADCASPDFTNSVIHLGTRLYPLSEFRPLTKDDTIFSHEQFRMGDDAPKVLGLSNGIRELMILIPDADVSRAWQAQRFRGYRAEFELGANILMYACDKNGILRKGDTYLVDADASVTVQKTIKVARIQYNGNWDPEPQAWPRLAAIMHNTMQTDLAIDAVTAGNGKLAGHEAAVLTGTATPHIDQAGWDEIKAYVNGGGTLIVDSGGGAADSTFTSTVHDELAAMFPAQAGSTGSTSSPQAGSPQAAALDSPLALSDNFYSNVGPPLTEVHFRPFARKALTDLSAPQLRALRFADRIGVFFSPQDITEGLVGQHVDGVVGYQPDTAAALMEKMLVSAEGK